MAFCVWMCAFPTPSVHSLWDGFDTLVGDHMVSHMRAHFWALWFGLLVHVSVVRSPPHCFDDQSFGKGFKSGSPKSCYHSLCSQDCFGFLDLLFIMEWIIFVLGQLFVRAPVSFHSTGNMAGCCHGPF